MIGRVDWSDTVPVQLRATGRSTIEKIRKIRRDRGARFLIVASADFVSVACRWVECSNDEKSS